MRLEKQYKQKNDENTKQIHRLQQLIRTENPLVICIINVILNILIKLRRMKEKKEQHLFEYASNLNRFVQYFNSIDVILVVSLFQNTMSILE